MTTIDLQDKFTSVNHEKIISKYWQDSFLSSNVIFDLKRLEWIANEQCSFLISWINKLWENNISVAIEFQSGNDVPPESNTYKRRKVCYYHLISNWNFFELIDSRTKKIDKGIKISKYKKGNLPYIEQPLIDYNSKTFDLEFSQLYDNDLKPFLNHLLHEIRENTELNYFDSSFLNYAIIKEFYSNSCQHAFKNITTQKSSFSINLNKSIHNLKGKELKDKLLERFSERPNEELAFFKQGESDYKNNSYIEITFADFGYGISNTIKENYLQENIDKIKHKLGKKHTSQNEDTRALEYAFLLFASRYELGKDLIMHDFIPRGLFVVKEIVKKYEGMLIARSNKGKVVFDYSNFNKESVVYRLDDFDSNIGIGFPGTMLTIILPAIKNPGISKISSKSLKTELLPEPYFINLLDFINKATKDNNIKIEKSETKKRILFFEVFFTVLIKDLLALDNKYDINQIEKISSQVEKKTKEKARKPIKKYLILFDFAGVERTNQDIFNKFIYFITYCPLISNNINVCLFNVMEKDINDIFVKDELHSIKSKGFIPKPIPCIHPDCEISWLGVENKEYESVLSDLWKNDDRKNKISDNIERYASNILAIEIEDSENEIFKFKILINSFFEIIEEIYKYHRRIISEEVNGTGIQFEELLNENHNYNIILNKKIDKKSNKQRAFQTSNTFFQEEFISFIEKLYIREYRRLISTYLFYNFLYDNELQLEKLQTISKVLTVTLSSQLLGKEIVDILNLLVSNNKSIELIPLSNYYDFNTEDSFSKISEKDILIIVNDVISTGNLSRKIENSLERKTKIFGILTIVDSRTINDKKDEIKATLTKLHDKTIKKFKENPFPDTKPIWINPILNSPTSMSREKTDINCILQTPQQFIRNFADDSLFKVGNFSNNSVYHSYYFNTQELINNELENGFPLIIELLQLLETKIKKDKDTSLDKDIAEINRIKKKYFSQDKFSHVTQKISMRIDKAFSEIENSLSIELSQNHQYDLFSNKKVQIVDFIFYPFLSSVSEIEKNLSPLSVKLRGEDKIEVFPIPRIMTPRGWRFSFPPKFLNFYSKNKKALIFDDGSCTGETLIQMIDSLSFLELSEIHVLSIFARLEDFQREFLTRIKRIKVKDSDNMYSGYKMIPLNVFFGTHFHIPVYNKNTHYNNIEKNELDNIRNYYDEKEEIIPFQLDDYIKSRLDIINNSKSTNYTSKTFHKLVDKKIMFLIRDAIGNYDSYRLFKEDDYNHQNESGTLKEMSLYQILENKIGKFSFIAVINHEPSVCKTVKRVYPDIIKKITQFCVEKLEDRDQSDPETILFIFKGLCNIDIDLSFRHDLLLNVLEKCELTEEIEVKLHNYLFFIFLREKIIYKDKSGYEPRINSLRVLLKSIYNTINDNKISDRKYFNLIKSLYGIFSITDDSKTPSKLKAIYKVQSYYSLQDINAGKNEISSHPNAYLQLTFITSTLTGFTNSPPRDTEVKEFILKTDAFFDGINSKLIKHLKLILDFLIEFFLKYDFSIEIDKYKALIKEFERLHLSIKQNEFQNKVLIHKANILSTVQWVKKFQQSLFKLSSELPKFFTHDYANLNTIVSTTISEYILTKSITPNIKFTLDENINLNINPYLLRLIIYEFIENQTKYAPDSNAEILYIQNIKSLQIIYRQDSAFKNDKENGLNVIRNIVNKHGGFCDISAIDNYEFVLEFPLTFKK